MIRLPPISTRTYTLCPYTTLFRSLIDVSTVEEVLAPAVALDRHEGGNVRCNVVGQTSCQICLPRDGVIICISKIEVPAEVVAGILRADADDTTGRIATKEGALRPFEDFDLVDAIELGQRNIQAKDAIGRASCRERECQSV